MLLVVASSSKIWLRLVHEVAATEAKKRRVERADKVRADITVPLRVMEYQLERLMSHASLTNVNALEMATTNLIQFCHALENALLRILKHAKVKGWTSTS